MGRVGLDWIDMLCFLKGRKSSAVRCGWVRAQATTSLLWKMGGGWMGEGGFFGRQSLEWEFGLLRC